MIRKFIIVLFFFVEYLFAQSRLNLPDIIVFNPDSSTIKNIQILSLKKNLAGIRNIPMLKLSKEIFLPPKQKFFVNPVYNFTNLNMVDTYLDISVGNKDFLDFGFKNIIKIKSFMNNLRFNYNRYDNYYFNRWDKTLSFANYFHFHNKINKYIFGIKYRFGKHIFSNRPFVQRNIYDPFYSYYIENKLFNMSFSYFNKDLEAILNFKYNKNKISKNESYENRKINFSVSKPIKYNGYLFKTSLNIGVDFINYRDIFSTALKKYDLFNSSFKISYENNRYVLFIKPFIFNSYEKKFLDIYFGLTYFVKKDILPLKLILFRDNFKNFHNREFSKSVYYTSPIYYKMSFPQTNNFLGVSLDLPNHLNFYFGYLYIEDFINIYNVNLRYVIKNVNNKKFLYSKLQFSWNNKYGEVKLLGKYYNPLSNDVFLVPSFLGEILVKTRLVSYSKYVNINLISLLSYYSKFKIGLYRDQNSVVFWDMEVLGNLNKSFFISLGIKNIFDNNFDYFLYTNRNYGRTFFLKLGYNIKWK